MSGREKVRENKCYITLQNTNNSEQTDRQDTITIKSLRTSLVFQRWFSYSLYWPENIINREN